MNELSLSSSRPLPPAEQELSDTEEDAGPVFAHEEISAPIENLHIRTKGDHPSADTAVGDEGKQLATVGDTAVSLAVPQPQDELDFLLEELGRIEDQQGKLRDAVKHNKGIVVHPRQEVLDASESDSDFDTPKAPTPKKKLLVSGGLTGFGVAQDLLQIDFSTIEEAPEEFKAVAFYEEPREIKPGLSGSFGFCDPASKEMHKYLERLEEQQRMVLEMISGKKQELIMSYATKGRAGKQGGKGVPGLSRLANSSSDDKAAVAGALGLNIPSKSSLDKAGAIGGPMRQKSAIADSLGFGGKGALAAKLPIIADAGSRSIVAKAAPAPQTPSTAQANPKAQEVVVPKQKELRPMRTRPEPKRNAAVQKEELARKELEELREQIGVPLPGSTPSTAHLAGKKQDTTKRSPAANASPSAQPVLADDGASTAEAPVTRPATTSRPQTKFANKFVQRGGGRVSTLGEAERGEDVSASTAAAGTAGGSEKKSGFFKGLKKIIARKEPAVA